MFEIKLNEAILSITCLLWEEISCIFIELLYIETNLLRRKQLSNSIYMYVLDYRTVVRTCFARMFLSLYNGEYYLTMPIYSTFWPKLLQG
jgi:hypothetical protein